jgi:hypothetical protein
VVLGNSGGTGAALASAFEARRERCLLVGATPAGESRGDAAELCGSWRERLGGADRRRRPAMARVGS